MKDNYRQKKIREEFFDTSNSVLVKAGPGTGKSTTMLSLAKDLNIFDKGIMLAFNNKIVKELKDKLSSFVLTSSVEASTLHTFGLRMVAKKFTFKVDKNKFYILYKDLYNTSDIKLLSRKEENVLKFSLKFLDQFSRIFLTDDFSEIKEASIELGVWEITEDTLLQSYWITFLEIREGFNNRSYKLVDFTDMLYFPVYFDLKCTEGYTHVFADECQDFSVLQHKLFEIICNDDQHVKFIAVGDDRQAINAFAGSSAESFEMFKSYANVVELPLDISYRCPPIITDELNKIYKGVIPFKSEGGSMSIKTERDLSSIPNKSLILCRNTAPLVSTLFLLAAEGKKCYILGKDTFNSAKKVMREYLYLDIDTALTNSRKELLELSANLKSETTRIRFFMLKEAIDIVSSLSSNFVFPYGTKLTHYFAKATIFFVASEDSIVLSTIHKSKGLENPNVYLINKRKLMPSKMARNEKSRIQEKNLFFVAVSRSSENFSYLNIKFEQ